MEDQFAAGGGGVDGLLQAAEANVTVLQGMRKPWSSATIKCYGGGVSEVFLGELSQLIGDYTRETISTSIQKDGRSRFYSSRRDRVTEVSDLAALPRGRAILIASGSPATLVRTLPWMDGPHAAAVRASIDAHDPAELGRPVPS